MHRNVQGYNSNQGGPNPFPILKIEATHSAKKPGEGRLDIEAGADKHYGTIRVVLWRRNVDSPIPRED